MKKPNYRQIAQDFLSRAIVTDHDLCLDFHPTEASEIIGKRIKLQEVTPDSDITAKFGICIDTEPDIDKIITKARRIYFVIPARQSMWKWIKKLEAKRCRILYAESTTFYYKIYCTAYVTEDDLNEWGKINIPNETIKKNVFANLDKGYREFQPFDMQDTEIAVVFGGPSINEFRKDIYEKAKSGMPVVTANGAYNWCLQNNIIPAAQIMLDGRAFNKRFVEPIQPNCQYFMCSQCDPEIMESIPRDQLWMWHPLGSPYDDLVREYYGDKLHEWTPIPGGTTVALRSFPLLLMLGFNKFHVYGLDSCITDTHHGYKQPEDDNKKVMVTEYGGRKFNCYPWMLQQCSDFLHITAKMIGPLCQMEIYGDGLIAHCIRTLAGEYSGSDKMALLRLRKTDASERGILQRAGHSSVENASVQE